MSRQIDADFAFVTLRLTCDEAGSRLIADVTDPEQIAHHLTTGWSDRNESP